MATYALEWIELYARRGGGASDVQGNRAPYEDPPGSHPAPAGRAPGGGLVYSHRGTPAEWSTCPARGPDHPLDVRNALDDGPFFTLHATPPSARCPIGAGIGPTFTNGYRAAEAAANAVLAQVTIAQALDNTLAS